MHTRQGIIHSAQFPPARSHIHPERIKRRVLDAELRRQGFGQRITDINKVTTQTQPQSHFIPRCARQDRYVFGVTGIGQCGQHPLLRDHDVVANDGGLNVILFQLEIGSQQIIHGDSTQRIGVNPRVSQTQLPNHFPTSPVDHRKLALGVMGLTDRQAAHMSRLGDGAMKQSLGDR